MDAGPPVLRVFGTYHDTLRRGDDGRWRLYLGAEPNERIDPLLAAVEADRGRVFWG